MFSVRRLVLVLAVAAAAGLMVVAAGLIEEKDREAQITDAAVTAVVPAGGDLDLRQARIGFQLDPAYTGRLLVDGRPIPDDQITRVIGLNQFYFTPGPGTETGALVPGRHRATAIFWKIGETEADGRSYSWSFNVH